MEASDFRRGMAELTRFYGRTLTHDQLDMWFEKVRHVNSQDFLAGVKWATDEEKIFPTPKVLLDYAEKARVFRRSREIQTENAHAKAFFEPRNHRPGLARESIQLIMRRLNDEIDTFELVEEMRKMEQKYPGIGWAREAEKLIRERLIMEDAQEALDKQKELIELETV